MVNTRLLFPLFMIVFCLHLFSCIYRTTRLSSILNKGSRSLVQVVFTSVSSNLLSLLSNTVVYGSSLHSCDSFQLCPLGSKVGGCGEHKRLRKFSRRHHLLPVTMCYPSICFESSHTLPSGHEIQECFHRVWS